MTNRLNHLASLLQIGDRSPDSVLESSLKSPDVGVERTVEERPSQSPISDEESQAIRQEKLDEIKAAVARGDYDSDDLLNKALGRMFERLGLDEVG